MAAGKRYKKKTAKKYIFRRIAVIVVCTAILAAAAALVTFLAGGSKTGSDKNASSSAGAASSGKEEPKEPYITATAKIGSSGDVMVHSTQLTAAKQSDSSYDFKNYFEYVKEYYSKYDLMLMNLEVTFGTSGNYSGYPAFNTPESLSDALVYGGVDMVLTANNHIYDTGYGGLLNTMKVLNNRNIDFIGTRQNTEQLPYKVKDVNGIKVATACYTYSTTPSAGRKALNGNVMSAEAGDLVATFDYNRLDEFYGEAQEALKTMKNQGAEISIIYMHWGNEYRYTPSTYQKQMAQKLCDMGWDVIIGGHPHVIQPFETLKSDDGRETVCIYSMGNAVSNQRKELMDSDNYSGHTEDGMIFELELQKWSTGKVEIKSVDILPTWVNHMKSGDRRIYRIVALDPLTSDWERLGVTRLSDAKASYNRTMAIVGEGLNAYRTARGLAAVPLTVK